MKSPGEALSIKLWETVEKGGGGLLGPWQARRMGRAIAMARREEVLFVAQAEAEASALKSGQARLDYSGPTLRVCYTSERSEPTGRIEPSFSLPRAAERALGLAAADYLAAEVNQTKAIFHAESWLETQVSPVPDASVDDDWLAAWRANAGRTSAEQMQRLWGRVLAGEVAAPNTYSLRTLDFLRTLSKSEADEIAKVAPFVVEDTVPSGFGTLLNKRGISAALLMRLQVLGLLSGVGGLGMGRRYSPGAQREVEFRVCGHVVVVRWARDSLSTQSVDLNGFQLSPLGVELITLCEVQPDAEFIESFADHLANQHLEVSVCSLERGPDGRARRVNCRAVKNRLTELLDRRSDEPPEV
ncbi:DUF2806 domain-containing protein [Rhizobacter sp. Root1221]|uniref:DUF2806 domain-containing protein n=1 Tax=Rhizobacter sp. Root1221 TaxID=1736433 RepID=UPI0006F92CB4|nr:DUF2806 domain-containing protein [Rhizobacter sp. Root1221]KQV85397.1 hypothetical protein ASC87_06805 [Rhizobacter sp. Root1221]